jgi:hypothetical protein
MCFAVVALLVIFDEADPGWAYAAAGAVVVLETAQWAIAAAARRRIPDVAARDLYASLPLERRDRRLINFMLVTLPLCLTAFAIAIPAGFWEDTVVVVVLIAIALMPGFIALYRVRRHNSWLAVSPIPAQPTSAQRDPR